MPTPWHRLAAPITNHLTARDITSTHRTQAATLPPATLVRSSRAASSPTLNPDSRQVEQSGFQELFTLESGKPATGSCPICYERVGNASPCVAP